MQFFEPLKNFILPLILDTTMTIILLVSLVITCLTVGNAFKAALGSGNRVRNHALFGNVGLFYGTSTGNTENVASYFESNVEVVAYIDDLTDPNAYDGYIFGVPTWHTDADTERSGTSWDEWLYQTLPSMDFKGKKIAIYGVGDAVNYPDNFCDAMGEIFDCFEKAGAQVFGATPTDIIEFSESKSVRDGKFVGMVFDEDNEPEKSEERASFWVGMLKDEGFPF